MAKKFQWGYIQLDIPIWNFKKRLVNGHNTSNRHKRKRDTHALLKYYTLSMVNNQASIWFIKIIINKNDGLN